MRGDWNEPQVSELSKFVDGVAIPQDRECAAALEKANDGFVRHLEVSGSLPVRGIGQC